MSIIGTVYSLFFVFSMQLIANIVQYKFCGCLDFNLGPMVSEATEPQVRRPSHLFWTPVYTKTSILEVFLLRFKDKLSN